MEYRIKIEEEESSLEMCIQTMTERTEVERHLSDLVAQVETLYEKNKNSEARDIIDVIEMGHPDKPQLIQVLLDYDKEKETAHG